MHSTRAANSRGSVRRLLGPALLTAGLTFSAANAPAATPPAQPAELQALEQHMSELTVTSERVAGKDTVSGKLPHSLGSPKAVSTSYSGEQSISPEFVNATLTIAGRTLTLLQLGETLYTHDESIAKRDGGRPWVAEKLSSKNGLFGSSPSLGGGGSRGSGAPSPTPFKSEAELLKEGSSIRALGASTVDGQATVGFAGTLTAQRLAEGELSKKQLAKLKHEHLKLKGSFETFIAANGVPVHTTVLLSIGKLRFSTSADVLAIDFPVTVPPPPAAPETISAAELEEDRKGAAQEGLEEAEEEAQVGDARLGACVARPVGQRQAARARRVSQRARDAARRLLARPRAPSRSLARDRACRASRGCARCACAPCAG